ncbi:MAG: DUF2071 domain-containing protein [Caldilineales bacterium]
MSLPASDAHYAALLHQRLMPPRDGRLDVLSGLAHFSLITYALPAERLRRYIPAERFDIPEFPINGQQLALLSAVPFLDVDFHFIHLVPALKWQFGQTNYRVYVFDKHTQQHAVWFFGTTLGSWVVHVARGLWGIPWHPATYTVQCDYDVAERRYSHYSYRVRSRWAAAEVELEDSGQPVQAVEGFASFAAMQLILTHPVDGFYHHRSGRMGSYSVWHEPITMTTGQARQAYFSLFERLELLSRAEMQQPHSVLIAPLTTFRVLLPPHLL